MRAAYVEEFGPAEAIRYDVLPDPEAAAGQVLVRVEAVAVDAVDTFVRSGRWRTPVSFPLVVGRDLVGTVVDLGAGVSGFRPGERVWTNSAGYGGRPGATAELVPVEHDRLYPLPADADPVPFVAALHPGATAHGIVSGRARVRPGETVAVIGANGAAGMCLVQVAAAYGARVLAVVRDERAADPLRSLGAADVVVAEAEDAPRRAATAGPDGIDVLVDTTGHVDVAAAFESLEARGRVVLVAGRGTVELDVWRFYTRETQLLGFVMSAMTVSELAAAAEWINVRHAQRPLEVSVGEVLGFADTVRAHAMVESGRTPRMHDGTRGRLVLRP
ncbi:MAG TPA: NADPH:quinone reductase [Nocardioidaceae bacterium]|nr:NADPH:quinone reductase [Nocardioidaceae bacterium]